MKYIEIIDNQIVKEHEMLPRSYKNISNFSSLTQEQLNDLSWADNAGVSFYPLEENRPVLPENSVWTEPSYSIDHDNHKVIAVFGVQSLGPQSAYVPSTVSARQIRLWLVKNNISLDSVQNAIDSIEDVSLRNSVSIEWEYAPYIERNHAMIETLALSLGLNTEDIDKAFLEASLI